MGASLSLASCNTKWEEAVKECVWNEVGDKGVIKRRQGVKGEKRGKGERLMKGNEGRVMQEGRGGG